MSLELPTPDELTRYEELGLTPDQALQQAGDLLTLYTGVSDTPSDPFEQRLIRDAILQMAWALQARWEDLEAVFSPFNTERIGSYSYSKMVENYHTAASSNATGVPLFDAAVRYFNRKQGVASATSEHVFKQGSPWAGDWWDPRSHDPNFPLFAIYKP